MFSDKALEDLGDAIETWLSWVFTSESLKEKGKLNKVEAKVKAREEKKEVTAKLFSVMKSPTKKGVWVKKNQVQHCCSNRNLQKNVLQTRLSESGNEEGCG